MQQLSSTSASAPATSASATSASATSATPPAATEVKGHSPSEIARDDSVDPCGGDALFSFSRRVTFDPSSVKLSLHTDSATGAVTFAVASSGITIEDLVFDGDELQASVGGYEALFELSAAGSVIERDGDDPNETWKYSICIRGPPSRQGMKPERTQ